MTKSSPATADRWAVSTRTSGDVLAAGASLPTIEMCLLGIPMGFTASEIQSWLRDLAGVAVETSRSDAVERPIPQLLHHALTGLLFSQTELWSHTGQPLPCAAVFVDGPDGVAFGWVGRARVMILLNGEPYEPQWVIVRDEAGHEAMSAMLPSNAHTLSTLEYWPHGEDGMQAPACLDAEFGTPPDTPSPSVPAVPAGAAAVTGAASPPSPVGEPQAQRAESQALPIPQTLTTQQPGLAPDPTLERLDQPDEKQSLPSTHHPSSATFSMQALPHQDVPSERGAESPAGLEITPNVVPSETGGEGGATAGVPLPPTLGGPETEAAPPAVWRPTSSSLPRWPEGEAAAHPVGRWLTRLVGFGRKAIARVSAPVAEAQHSPHEPVPGSRQAGHDVTMKAPVQESLSLDPPAIAARHEMPKPDISEPHALPESAGGTAVPPPATPKLSTPKPARQKPAPEKTAAQMPAEAKPAAAPAGDVGKGARRISAAGLEDILGTSAGASRTIEPGRPLEGLTALSAASGPLVSQPGSSVIPESLSPAAPPYPIIEVKAPQPGTAGIQIEREPVGADESFAIPKLPPRGTPKPVRVPAAQPLSATPDSPAGSQLEVVPVASVTSSPPPREPARAPLSATPAPAVPEPPADFLAEFAASLRLDEQVKPKPKRGATPAAPPPDPRVDAPPPRASAPAVPEAPVRVPPAPVPPAREAAVISVKSDVAPESAAPARTPPVSEPPVVAVAEAPALMREVDLSSPPDEMAQPAGETSESEIPDGVLLATPASAMPAHRRSRRPSWPAAEELVAGPLPAWRKPWVLAVVITLLFGIGWLVGHSQAPDNDVHATPFTRLLRTFGLGGARFTATVDSDPPGAWISVDGKELSRQTPATLELLPGSHTLALSMPEFGGIEVKVSGSRGQKLKLNESLHGSLDVHARDASLPVKMSLDGQPQGWLPVHVDRIPPGMHEVQFSGPGMQPWGQSVNVGIRQATDIVARPMTSPATGQLQVAASLNDDSGTAPLSGANVFVDGDLRGTTPLNLELPRGPHSLRVTYRGETPPVQVIDLPGGNRRFASFQFGLDSDLPPLKLQGGYASLPVRRPTTVTAELEGLDPRDLREAWLHVRSAEGLWRRYQMTISDGGNGPVLSVAFPNTPADPQGRVTWYLSAATTQGDEFYTEIQRSTR